MISLYFVSFVMLGFNLTMEYGTLKKRHGVVTHVVIRVLSIVLVLTALKIWDDLGWDKTSLYRYSITIVVFFFSCQFLFRESFTQKAFLYFMDFSATVFVASFCTWIALQFPPGWLREIINGVLFTGILGAFLPVYFRFIRHRVREMLDLFRKTKPFYAAFPALSFVFLVYHFGYLRASESPVWFAQLLLYGGLVILTYYLLFSHFLVVYEGLKAEADLVHAERQLSLQKKYFEEVDRGLEAQQKFLHDTRHHLVAVSAMARTGDFQGVDRYIERILAAQSTSVMFRYCQNSVINAILGGYAKIAESKNIAVCVDIDLPEGSGLDEYKLCTLFGNTLENAIEACERIPAASEAFANRFVRLKVRQVNRRLVIRVENSYVEDPQQANPGFFSSKGSGIGLKSVRKVVDEYQGSMSCDRDGSVFTFSAVLPMAKSPEPRGTQIVP